MDPLASLPVAWLLKGCRFLGRKERRVFEASGWWLSVNLINMKRQYYSGMTTIVLLNMKLIYIYILKFGWNLRLLDETTVILGLCMFMSSRMKLVSFGMFKSETTILQEPWEQFLTVIPNVYMMNQGVSIRGWHDPIPGSRYGCRVFGTPNPGFLYGTIHLSGEVWGPVVKQCNGDPHFVRWFSHLIIAFYSWFSQPCWIPGGFLRSWCPMQAPSVDQRVPGDVADALKMSPRSAALLGGQDFSPTRIENKLG